MTDYDILCDWCYEYPPQHGTCADTDREQTR